MTYKVHNPPVKNWATAVPMSILELEELMGDLVQPPTIFSRWKDAKLELHFV